MSLGLVIKGPEGLVLAAESRLTLQATDQVGQTLLVGYDNATKLFALPQKKGKTVAGAVTYGLAAIAGRTAFSFMPEFEVELPDDPGSVEDVARALGGFYKKQWDGVQQAAPDIPMTFVVAGFNDGEAYGRVYLVEIPNGPDPVEQSPGEQAFGMTWGGQREFVDRLLQGYDPRVLAAMEEVLNTQPTVLDQLQTRLRALQMQLPLPVLPLQDCVDLAIFFIRTTIDAQRFTVGVHGCGGPIDVAIVTRSGGFQFVQQKQIRGEQDR